MMMMLPTQLPTYPPTYLRIYLPTHLPTYPPTYGDGDGGDGDGGGSIHENDHGVSSPSLTLLSIFPPSCMYVVCMYVCLYGMNASKYICVHVSMHACLYAVSVCMYLYIVCMHACKHVCMEFVCTVCM